MVAYPTGFGQRPIDPVFARALAEENKSRPKLLFKTLPGSFVSKHTGGTAVTITEVTGFRQYFSALIFKTPLNEDLDGAPNSYAPPIGVVTPAPSPPGSTAPASPPQLILDPRPGLHPIETSLKNATNKKGDVFHIDPKLNTFVWTGVKHSAGGARADVRDFLRDSNGEFPIFNPAASTYADYYAPQTAMDGADGQAVNPLEVPYAALSTALKANGGIRLGDVGLAIRTSTGASSEFIYADSGGDTSNSVGECSRKMIRNLFGGPPTNEDICYIVLRHTSAGPIAKPELTNSLIQSKLKDLKPFASDALGEFLDRCANPQLGSASNISAADRGNVRTALSQRGAAGIFG